MTDKQCDICEGIQDDWGGFKYKRCEAHDVCSVCKTPRKELTESPWGTRQGIICKPCESARQDKAVEDYQATEPGEWDFHHNDAPKCPHCGYEMQDAYELGDCSDYERECGNCGRDYLITSEVSVTYSTEVKEKKQ